MIEIALCTDKNYIIPTGVLIHSIEKTNKNADIHYNIIAEQLDESEQNSLKECISNKTSSISFYFIDRNIFKDCPIRKGDYITLASYFRILFPSIFKPEVSKILYLDGDMICLDSINSLWNKDISDYSAGVVIDIYSSDIRRINRLSLDIQNEYFNAGMMLINLDWWRKNNVQNKALKFISENPDTCVAHDQDALNKVLEGTVKFLEPKYNLLLDFWKKDNTLFVQKKHFSQIAQAKKFPVIVHFSGAEKPWHKECVYPLRNLWDYFLNETQWKGLKKVNKHTGKKRIKLLLRSFLESIKFLESKNPYKTIDVSDIELKIIDRIEKL